MVVQRWPWAVIGFWVAFAAILSVTIPPLTEMASKRPVPILPSDAPVLETTRQISEAFHQSGSENENVLLVVLTDDNGLNPSDLATYRKVADDLRPNTRDIVMLQDFIRTPALRDAMTSKDHKAWYLPMVLSGGVGTPALHAGFGTKLAWVGAEADELVFVGRDDEDARVAAGLAGAIGITAPSGYLSGGMTSWRMERRDVARIGRIDVPGLFERREREPELQILDVREEVEWRARRIPGSVHVAYHDIEEVPPQLDRSRPIAVICESGQRSAVAASIVQRLGASDVIHVVDGGVGTWARAGHPVEDDALSAPSRAA